jgi:AcrR family transcriptional regulator
MHGITQPRVTCLVAAKEGQRERSFVTQAALMRAAEKLFAEKGVESVSIRDIVSSAGQKNESALQYHFKNFKGLIRAIKDERSQETQTKRSQLIDTLLASTSEPTLRQLCTLMIQPAFDLARSNPDFRRYIKAFGHELALAESSALAQSVSEGGGGGDSGRALGNMLQRALPHLNKAAYRRRMEAAVRMCAASMYYQARQKNAFRGRTADLFFNDLVDALEGLLNAPESEATRALAKVADA